MKTYRKINNRQEGGALFAVLVVIFMVCALLGTMVSASLYRSFVVRKLSDHVRAMAIAEGGANQAYTLLSTNFNARTNGTAFPLTSYGGGTFDAAVTAVDNDMAVICCTGVYGYAVASVIVDLKDYGSGGGGGAFDYAIVSGDNMTFTGSGTTDVNGGAVYANGQYKMTGSCRLAGNLFSSVNIWSTGSTEINGDATAPAWQGKSPGNVTGTATTEAVTPIEIPDIDLTPYYNEALANGEVYDGDQHFSGSEDKAPVGGIMWVNGDLRISGSGNMIGCFIATGDVKISGSGNQTKVGDYPAIVSRDADIVISGSGKYHGLIYAKSGNFRKSGSGDTAGSIICAGTFKKSGSWCIMTYEDSTPVPPGASGSTDQIGISAWQK